MYWYMSWTDSRWEMFGLQSVWHKPGLSYLLWPFYLIYYVYYVSLVGFLNILFVYTHALWPLCSTQCKQNPEPALMVNSGLLLCVTTVDERKPCKIRYAHHHHWSPLAPRRCCTSQPPPSIFPAGLFPLQASFSAVAMDLWICSQ